MVIARMLKGLLDLISILVKQRACASSTPGFAEREAARSKHKGRYIQCLWRLMNMEGHSSSYEWV